MLCLKFVWKNNNAVENRRSHWNSHSATEKWLANDGYEKKRQLRPDTKQTKTEKNVCSYTGMFRSGHLFTIDGAAALK